jgi:predicted Zn-ribbon and HTH transcriptional regulator
MTDNYDIAVEEELTRLRHENMTLRKELRQTIRRLERAQQISQPQRGNVNRFAQCLSCSYRVLSDVEKCPRCNSTRIYRP